MAKKSKLVKNLKSLIFLLLILSVCGLIIHWTYSSENGQEAIVVKTIPVTNKTYPTDSTKLVPTMFVKSGISPSNVSSSKWTSYIKETYKTPTLNTTFKAAPKAPAK